MQILIVYDLGIFRVALEPNIFNLHSQKRVIQDYVERTQATDGHYFWWLVLKQILIYSFESKQTELKQNSLHWANNRRAIVVKVEYFKRIFRYFN